MKCVGLHNGRIEYSIVIGLGLGIGIGLGIEYCIVLAFGFVLFRAGTDFRLYDWTKWDLELISALALNLALILSLTRIGIVCDLTL